MGDSRSESVLILLARMGRVSNTEHHCGEDNIILLAVAVIWNSGQQFSKGQMGNIHLILGLI